MSPATWPTTDSADGPAEPTPAELDVFYDVQRLLTGPRVVLAPGQAALFQCPTCLVPFPQCEHGGQGAERRAH